MGQQPPNRQQPFEQSQSGRQVPLQYPQSQEAQTGLPPMPNSLSPQRQFQWTPQQPRQYQPPPYPLYNSPPSHQQYENTNYATMHRGRDSHMEDSPKVGHKRRFLFVLLIVALVILVVGGFVFVYDLRTSTNTTTATPTTITIVWKASTTSFTQQDLKNIQIALQSVLLAPPNPHPIAGHEFTIIDAQRQGSWVILSANERVNTNANPIPTEPLFFIVHQQGANWAVWTPGLAHFCDQLKQIPDTLLDPIDKHYFRGCYQ